jgi:outer membrane receptor protein involved in Fe transport
MKNYSGPLRASLIASSLFSAAAVHAQNADGSDSGGLQEVTVTATRVEQVISKVPISISAFTQQQMEAQGVKQVDDLVRLTPGLTLQRLATGTNAISIRGISSGAGAGTTGVYIDDAPIQVRSIGYGAGTAFPAVFDLERVEVLRGPQGTLFGAGSEGGTVRFIQTTPSLKDYSVYARGEFSNTRGGDPTYEGGAAFGGPIIDDRLGFRLSGYYRREGGYIDGITGTPTVVDPSGASYGNSITFDRTGVARENTNWLRTTGFRGALKFMATDSLAVTPSVTYQKQHVNDGSGTYWLSTSNPRSHDYTRPIYTAGNPATNPGLTALDSPDTDEGDDEFTLPAVTIDWNLGPVELVSNSSYFDRKNHQWLEFSNFYSFFYGISRFALPGNKAASVYRNSQKNYTQELRLQSTDADSRLNWVVGAFYSHNKQTAQQRIGVNFLVNASPAVGTFFDPQPGFTGGAPFGPGFSALENYFGVPADPGSVLWGADFTTVDKQMAGFAQADFKITPALTLTAGVRVSKNDLALDALYSGPENNLKYAHGMACVPNTSYPTSFDADGFPLTFDCAPQNRVAIGQYRPGTGPFAPEYPTSNATNSESAVTPKVGLSYQLNDANMVYATASKGFRPAGASLLVPASQCGPDLGRLGYTDANGNSTQPELFESDSVWSYELGTKNRVANGRVLLDASVYLIRWSNIQTNVGLNECGYTFVDNNGSVTSKGFDLGFQARPIDPLLLTGAIGYSDATFDHDTVTPNGTTVLFGEGTTVPGSSPPWTIYLSGQYDFHLFAGRRFYARADYTHSTEAREGGVTDLRSGSYDPLLRPVEAYSVVNARLGVDLAGADVSLFINNLTDSDPELAKGHGGVAGPRALWTSSTLRARTYGLTVSYRY